MALRLCLRYNVYPKLVRSWGLHYQDYEYDGDLEDIYIRVLGARKHLQYECPSLLRKLEDEYGSYFFEECPFAEYRRWLHEETLVKDWETLEFGCYAESTSWGYNALDVEIGKLVGMLLSFGYETYVIRKSRKYDPSSSGYSFTEDAEILIWRTAQYL